jgi:hypothetical protein
MDLNRRCAKTGQRNLQVPMSVTCVTRHQSKRSPASLLADWHKSDGSYIYTQETPCGTAMRSATLELPPTQNKKFSCSAPRPQLHRSVRPTAIITAPGPPCAQDIHQAVQRHWRPKRHPGRLRGGSPRRLHSDSVPPVPALVLV